MTIVKEKRKDGSRRVAISFRKDKGRTKQEFKNECDINNILAKFRKTGALAHVQKHGPQYGYASGLQYDEAMRVVATGNTVFEELPSHIRQKYKGPADFLDFVQDPANEKEVREMFGESPLPSAEPTTTPPDGAAVRIPAVDDPKGAPLGEPAADGSSD